MKVAYCFITSVLAVAAMSGGSFLIGQEAVKGAKTFFYDAANDTRVLPPQPNATVAAKPAGNKPSRTSVKTSTDRPGLVQQNTSVNDPTPQPPDNPTLPSALGLKYYVELMEPDGQLIRVNASRSFKSGEKIRLHFESNFSGHLVIIQKQKGLPLKKLFPDDRIDGGKDYVSAFKDIVIPSKAWFEFDDYPGEIELMVFLTPEETYNNVIRPHVTALNTESSARALEEQIFLNVCGSKGLQLADGCNGSKGIRLIEVVESDVINQPSHKRDNIVYEEPATFVVYQRPSDVIDKQSDMVALEIVVNHSR